MAERDPLRRPPRDPASSLAESLPLTHTILGFPTQSLTLTDAEHLLPGLTPWWLFLPLGLVGGYFLTDAARRHLLARGVMDVPNERSAHAAPIPLGGGIAVAGVCVLGIALGTLLGLIQPNLAIGFVGGVLVVATVGWIDDLRRASVRLRLGAHMFAAIWALLWIGGYPVLHFGSGHVELGAFGFALAAVGITWGINFFNFMDGIDGIVAAEAVFFGLAAAVLLSLSGPAATGLAIVALMIAGASGGFLRWNWAPAKVFLGGTGSTVLGFLICTLAVTSENVAGIPMLTWGTLLLVFIYDPTVTLVRRVILGYDWRSPHREFAFHRAVRLGWSHRQVTVGVALVNLVLACLAWAGLPYPSLLLPMVALGAGFLTIPYAWIERRLPMASRPYVNPSLGSVAAPSSSSPTLVSARDRRRRSRDLSDARSPGAHSWSPPRGPDPDPG